MSRQSDPSFFQSLGSLASLYAAVFRTMARRMRERSEPHSVDVWLNPELREPPGMDDVARHDRAY